MGLIVSINSVQAAHYLQGYSAVDEREIRWGGSTQYNSEWQGAINTWNSEGEITIASDTIWTYEDLKLSDVNRDDLNWTGRYTYYRFGTDTLELNIAKLSGKSEDQRQNTATHELGHALGLNHSFSGNILYTFQTSQTYLGSQDRDDYNYLWVD